MVLLGHLPQLRQSLPPELCWFCMAGAARINPTAVSCHSRATADLQVSYAAHGSSSCTSAALTSTSSSQQGDTILFSPKHDEVMAPQHAAAALPPVRSDDHSSSYREDGSSHSMPAKMGTGPLAFSSVAGSDGTCSQGGGSREAGWRLASWLPAVVAAAAVAVAAAAAAPAWAEQAGAAASGAVQEGGGGDPATSVGAAFLRTLIVRHCDLRWPRMVSSVAGAVTVLPKGRWCMYSLLTVLTGTAATQHSPSELRQQLQKAPTAGHGHCSRYVGTISCIAATSTWRSRCERSLCSGLHGLPRPQDSATAS